MHPMTHLPRCTDALKKEVTNLDNQYDRLQEVWTNGEAQGFMTEKLLVNIYIYTIWHSNLCRSYDSMTCESDCLTCVDPIFSKIVQVHVIICRYRPYTLPAGFTTTLRRRWPQQRWRKEPKLSVEFIFSIEDPMQYQSQHSRTPKLFEI